MMKPPAPTREASWRPVSVFWCHVFPLEENMYNVTIQKCIETKCSLFLSIHFQSFSSLSFIPFLSFQGLAHMMTEQGTRLFASSQSCLCLVGVGVEYTCIWKCMVLYIYTQCDSMILLFRNHVIPDVLACFMCFRWCTIALQLLLYINLFSGHVFIYTLKCLVWNLNLYLLFFSLPIGALSSVDPLRLLLLL